jgi:hypothetical protein
MAKKPLPKDEGNRILADQGWFHGLNFIVREYGLTAEETAKVKAGLFQLMLAKVLEAKAEIAKLQTVLTQMEATCRQGSRPNPAEGSSAYGPTVEKVRDNMRALDGWAISLLESDISLLAAVENPETAGGRVKSLQNSFAELWNIRLKGYKLMASHPEVFDLKLYIR